MSNSHVNAFIRGSSILSTIITLSYLGYYNSKTNAIKNYELVPIVVSVLIGLSNVINVYLVKKYKNDNISVVVGAGMGLVLSLSGRFLENNLPINMFGFTKKNINIIHVVAMVLYAFIFRFIISRVNKL
jgi:hypothetical protein